MMTSSIFATQQKRRRSSLARRMLDADMDSDLPEPYSGMMISVGRKDVG